MVALDRNCPRRWWMLRALAAIAPLLALPLAASSALASSWVPVAEPLASSVFLRSDPAVAMDAGGTATELWAQGPEESPSTLESSRLAPGGAWSSPVSVPNHLHAREPALAVTPDGHATAVWSEEETNGQRTIYSSQSVAGGPWSQSVELSSAGRFLYGPSVAVQANGAAAATWLESGEGNEESMVASVRNGETWSTPLRLSAPGVYAFSFGRGVDLVADAAGFLAIWNQYESEGSLYSVHADQYAAGAWQGDQVITTGQRPVSDATVAVDEAGDATALWVDYTSGTLQSATLRGGQWTTQPIEGSHQIVGCGMPQPDVGVDGAGTSTAAWIDNGQVVVDTLPAAAGAWGQPERLTDLPETEGAFELALGVDPAGAAALVWDRRSAEEGSAQVEGSYRSPGGAWEAPVGLSSAGTELSSPSLAIGPQGWALTSWSENSYQPNGELRYAYAKPPATVASAPSQPAGGGPSGTPTTSAVAKLAAMGPVYLVVPRSRLRLARHSHTLTALIRNRNPYAVSGTATMSYYLLAPKGAHSASRASAPAIASVARFTLGSYGQGRVRFRLSARALRRLYANVPDSGHDLVSIRLVVSGPSGERSAGSTVYALDAPAHLARRHGRHHRLPSVPPDYRAPVDPWVAARAAC